MISILNLEELQIAQNLGNRLSFLLDFLLLKINLFIGKSLMDLEIFIKNFFKKEKNIVLSLYKYLNFPNFCCISNNNSIIHGLSNSSLIKNGDVLKVDIVINNTIGPKVFVDAARTYLVGIKNLYYSSILNSYKQFHLLLIKNNFSFLSEIVRFIEKFFNKKKKWSLIKNYISHFIGKNIHELGIPSFILDLKKDLMLINGNLLAIEPIIKIGSSKVILDKNGWNVKSFDDNVGFHFENTFLFKNFKLISLTSKYLKFK